MGDKEQVISALRATLISVKGALTIKQCNRDFKELQGEWIPFKRLGYPSLEKLFQDVPGFKVKEINGEWYVDAIASQETQHIATMVAKQKSSKKTGPKLNYPSRFPKRQDSWRTPAALSGNYKSNYNNQYSNQYYRAKGPPPRTYGYNSNPSFNKYNKYSKPNETRNTNQYSKQVISRTVSDHSEVSHNNTAKNNSTTTAKKDTPPPPEQVKQPTKIEVEPAPKPTKVSASQRLSNLRDRLNTVDLIPLQLPSMTNECTENSGPVSTVAPAHSLEPPPDSTSSVEKLEWTCQKLGLPQPVFKVLDIRPKRGPVSYDCSVKVGNQYKATSYPDSAPSEEIAKEVAAVKLLASIESSQMGGLPTSSDSKALASLADLVAEHEAGLWASTVAHLYREKYGENLPNNWQELVENCPRIIKDRVVNGLLVLLPNNESPVAPSPADTTVLDDSIDSDLPPLQFPDDNYWNVFVTVANSTLEIWLRIIGVQYSDAFEALLADMGRHYDRYGTSVEKSMLINNAWYAVNLEDGGWQRAKILEIEEDRATVFLGDHGDDDVVSLDKIKILEPQFRKLPAQAILCRLEGAEELAASSQAGELVRARLQGEVLVAAPGPRDDPAEPAVSVVLYDTSTARDLNLNKEIIHDFCISGAFSITQAPGPRDDPAEPAVSVVLYDTSTARDLNLNKEIIHDFCISGAFSITQKACEVRVGCVTEEGRVWVSRAGGAALVRAALALLTAPGPYRRPLPASPPAPPPPPPAAPAPLYIVRTIDGDWVRCTMISGLDGEGTVRTLLVDSGLVLRAPLSSLVPLHAFSPALNAYPHQAIQVRLGAAERAASGMVTRLRELLLTSGVLCRALPSPPGTPAGPPHAELFVRTGPQNILASVNNAILMEYEYLQTAKPKESNDEDTSKHVEALHRKKERIFRSSGEDALRQPHAAPAPPLPPPPLPPPGKCFDVYIAMAANPWNFVVQPNSTRHALRDMMASLQTECPKLPEADAPPSPASGELYVGHYDKDNSWYRVIIAGTVSSEMVSVYFCDYGDLALLGSASLRPVPASVPLARSLPPQAIKARLYDVWPLHQDWTVEDCIRFQELCVEQQFVGICKDVGRDPLNLSEPLITLDLIDTSTDEDVYLNKALVAEGRARLGAQPQ